MAVPKHIIPLACKRLKAGHILSDASPYRGLRLVASSRGLKVWQFRFKDASGRMKQVKLGEYPAMSLADARRLLDDRRNVIRAGGPVREIVQAPGTIGLMVEQYLAERIDVDRKEKGAKEVRRLFARDLPPIADMLPEQFTPELAHAFVLAIDENSAAQNTMGISENSWRR